MSGKGNKSVSYLWFHFRSVVIIWAYLFEIIRKRKCLIEIIYIWNIFETVNNCMHKILKIKKIQRKFKQLGI